jgi:dephospho-CoA kinase
VACSPLTQHQRLLERGWSADQIQQRVAAQLPVEQKIARSNFVLWTEGLLDVHQEQVGRVFRQL